jgi:hypothetical protein
VVAAVFQIYGGSMPQMKKLTRAEKAKRDEKRERRAARRAEAEKGRTTIQSSDGVARPKPNLTVPVARPKPNLTVPVTVTDDIAAFCRDIAPLGTPQYVNVKPVPGARLNECFVNVDRYAALNGGSVSYGWNVMEWPSTLLEAEFHAVWRGPHGEMLDVTPKVDGEERILFLPDDARVYKGAYTPSIQRAPAGAPAEAAEFIEACQAKWAFEASHFVDDGVDGSLSLSGSDLLTHQRLAAAVQAAHRRLVAVTTSRAREP